MYIQHDNNNDDDDNKQTNKIQNKWNETHTKSRVKGEPADIDPECVSHDEYLSEFKSMLITKLRNAIDTDILNDPDCIKGRKKTVQVSFHLFC